MAIALFAAACGSDDDGAAVRNVGEESSGSASGSGSGSASGSHASGSEASGSEASGSHASGSMASGECEVEDGIEATDAEQVAVTLDEWGVGPESDQVTPGAVTFAAENIGEDEHELVVVKAADADSLPTDDDGAVDLEALGEDVIGEIEAFPGGDTCEGTFELTAGDYVLLCNLVHDDEVHFAEGMHAPFTVTG